MKCRPIVQSSEPSQEENAAERRRHPRVPASGPIQLHGEDPLPFRVDGELVDVSEGGFRLAHRHATLHPGQEVRFEHPGGQGWARVMWTCVSPGRVESGCMILA